MPTSALTSARVARRGVGHSLEVAVDSLLADTGGRDSPADVE